MNRRSKSLRLVLAALLVLALIGREWLNSRQDPSSDPPANGAVERAFESGDEVGFRGEYD